MFDVSIVPCNDYQPDLVREALLSVLEPVGGLCWVQPGMKVAIKANLVSALKPETAAAVHPTVAAELTRLLTQRGAVVTLGDSPGGLYNAAALNHVYAVTGMRAVLEAGGRLNDCFATAQANHPQACAARSFTYTAWLDDADVIISLCKLKTHALMTMTAAVKNQFGVIPGTVKPEYHFRYPESETFANMLVDLNEYFRQDGRLRLCLCDAVWGMEGNGPTQGTPRHVGALLAAGTPYALDLAAAAVLGVEPDTVPTITAAAARGLCPEHREDLAIRGDLDSFVPETPFTPAGTSKSLFVINPGDGPAWKLAKRGLQAALAARPTVTDACVGCGVCAGLCPAHALTILGGKARINRKVCIRCFCCQEFCPRGAMVAKRALVGKLLEASPQPPHTAPPR